MTKTVDAHSMLVAAEPLVHQHAPEIQAYEHIISMPLAHIRSPSGKHERQRALHEVDSPDAVAGSEFVDDRIRLGE
jgi:hypothetical protein